jgi:signal transduction histidine kinase
LVRTLPNGKIDHALLPSPVEPRSNPLSKPTPSVAVKQLRAQALATHAVDMHEMLILSGVALTIMTVLAIGLGWLVSGRMLRPLRTITATTQQITEHNLHERLALAGPRDEVRDLADTIDGLLRRLAAAFDAQRHFVANASHELRTPLILDRALLEVTLADPEASVDDLRAMSQELIASGEHQERLIESLLTLAISDRGLERHEPFDLSEVTTAALLGPHPEVDELGLDIQRTMTPAPAIGDPQLAERLVANLFDNALRHNVAGGHINIATQTVTGGAVLRIDNSGPIIADEDVERLFQPFQRVESARTNRPAGHGLGLSIVHAIADAHGAVIAARAAPGGGLSIEVSFPTPVKDEHALPHAFSTPARSRVRRATRHRRDTGFR